VNNPGLSPALWAALDGRLWHATGPSEFAGILADGEIRVFANRYLNSLCKAYGAVSLLDFGPSATDCDQFNNWVGWMGHQQKSRFAVWLEIDRAAVSPNLYDAEATLALNRDASFPCQLIPGIEACHRGPISVAAIRSVLLIDQHFDHARFEECPFTPDIIPGLLADFERSLRPPPAPGFADALEAEIAKRAAAKS
jgi:hypothetical protein